MSQVFIPFDLDKYVYEDGGYYNAFKRDVDEKICAAKVSETLAQALRHEGLVYKDGQSIPVADIGCGPADSIQMYLEGAQHQAGFDLHVTDYNLGYTGPSGLAHTNLRKAQQTGKIKLNNYSITNGDAFGGKLTGLLGTSAKHFPLAFISHMFYHTAPEQVGRMLEDVSNNVLQDKGVGILFHLENKPKSFQYFRSKYGHKKSDSTSDTPAMEVDNPPATVEEACRKANIPCHTAHYDNNYYFGPMDEKYWEIFKHPKRYHEITDPNAVANLRKLYFIVQRAANEFAADRSALGLSAFIDEARSVIAPQQVEFEKEGGFMQLAETAQLIGSTHADEITRAKLERAAQYLEKQLPRLTQESFIKWQHRWASMDNRSLAFARG